MSNGLINALSQFIHGIIGIVVSIFNSIFAVVHAIFALGVDLVSAALGAVTQVGVMGLRMCEGLVGFVVDNFVAIAIIAAAGYAYTVYGRRNGVGQTQGHVKSN